MKTLLLLVSAMFFSTLLSAQESPSIKNQTENVRIEMAGRMTASDGLMKLYDNVCLSSARLNITNADSIFHNTNEQIYVIHGAKEFQFDGKIVIQNEGVKYFTLIYREGDDYIKLE